MAGKRRWNPSPERRKKHAEWQSQRQKDKGARFQEYKNTLTCERCGFADGRALVFHHRNPTEKEFTIGRVARHYSWERLMQEVEKCEVICANCHAIEHLENGRHA